jgi:death-on-curing protein
MNGRRLTLGNDEAYGFVISVATGELDDVAQIAAVLASNSTSPAA